MNIDRAKFTLLTGFFETYLTLTPSEEETLREEVKAMEKQESDKVMEIMVSYEKKGMEKGWKQGKKEGKEKGKKEGIEQGKEIKQMETASAMLKKDMDIDLIAEITGLPTEEILRLKDK
ncbi:transposase [Salibacterium sp. K-3]